MEELELLKQGGTAVKKERRKLQNRFAQRAFRARSKVKNTNVSLYNPVNWRLYLQDATRLNELEEVFVRHENEVQSLRDAIYERDEMIMQLQQENNTLKANQWATFMGQQ